VIKKLALVCIFFIGGTTCFGQADSSLCPKHIEAPEYSAIARTAHMVGKFAVKISVDADGKVSSAEIEDLGIDSASQILGQASVMNARRWTFEKPPRAPYDLTIKYEYGFDKSLPVDHGDRPITKVILDLPNHVSIVSNDRIIMTDDSKSKN
jgi:Gram-negative bacterial TonB protein C-terminal